MTRSVDGTVSVVRRWKLAASLKELRERAELRQEQAVEQLKRGAGRWSRSKLSRIENREHSVKPREVEQLLDAFGVTDASVREELLQLANDSREQGWWLSFSNELPKGVLPLVSIEGGLVGLRDFQNQLVHGLLQTADYARAVMNSVYPGEFSPAELERRIAARMARQQVLTRESPPRMHFILDQTILDRGVGRPSVMRDQLRKLLDMTENPDITIQILPNTGGSPGLEGPFSILSLPEPVPDIGYTEGPAGSLYIEDREHVRACTLRFGALTKLALSRADSIDAISKAMEGHQ